MRFASSKDATFDVLVSDVLTSAASTSPLSVSHFFDVGKKMDD